MTLVALGTDFYFPCRWLTRANGPAETSVTLDAADEAVANVLQIPLDGTCVGARVFTGTVTTGATVTISIETVDATTGAPTGTLYHANATATVAIADTDDNAEISVTYTGFTVNQGDIVAVVVTAPGSGVFDMTFKSMDWLGERRAFPYITRFVTGAWVKRNQESPMVLIEYTGGVFHPIPDAYPYDSIVAGTYDNGTTPDQHAVKFTLPFGGEVRGFWVQFDFDGATDVELLDSVDTVIDTVSIDPDIRSDVIQDQNIWLFADPHELTKDAVYRLNFKPTTTTNINMHTFDCAGSAQLGGTKPGANIVRSTRTDAGAWTDFNGHLPAGLLFNSIDIPAGAGTSSILGGGNMTGGMQ